jgi:hypothetical protein
LLATATRAKFALGITFRLETNGDSPGAADRRSRAVEHEASGRRLGEPQGDVVSAALDSKIAGAHHVPVLLLERTRNLAHEVAEGKARIELEDDGGFRNSDILIDFRHVQIHSRAELPADVVHVGSAPIRSSKIFLSFRNGGFFPARMHCAS